MLRVRGAFYPSIEVKPSSTLFFSVAGGESKRKYVEILNHESEPLEILGIENISASLNTELEMLEAGRRYRLWITFNGGGPPSETIQRVTLITSSAKRRFVDIEVRMPVKHLGRVAVPRMLPGVTPACAVGLHVGLDFSPGQPPPRTASDLRAATRMRKR